MHLNALMKDYQSWIFYSRYTVVVFTIQPLGSLYERQRLFGHVKTSIGAPQLAKKTKQDSNTCAVHVQHVVATYWNPWEQGLGICPFDCRSTFWSWQ